MRGPGRRHRRTERTHVVIGLVLALALHALRRRPRPCTCCPAHRPAERPDVRGAVPR